MHILYLDDSGSAGNPADRHVVLAGVSVFEREPHWLCGHLDRVVTYGGQKFVMDQKTTGSTIGPYFFDGFKPDRWDLIGAGACLAGALVILLGPRSMG